MSRGPGARVLMLLVSGCVVAGCTVPGTAGIAPYVARPPESVTARVVAAPDGLLALAPNGTVAAVADATHGVCFVPVANASTRVCAAATVAGRASVTASFSPDGRTLALGQNVNARSRGVVALVDVASGALRPVASVPVAAGVASFYVNLAWNASDGHLQLVSGTSDARTRLVDVDPASMVPRVVALATGPDEFQSGQFAVGGSRAVFTVFRADQAPPNVVVVNTATGVRTEFGPIGPGGTQVVPLAVAPDGAHAIVGLATYGHPGPPQLLDLSTGKLAPISGLAGDFGVAAYSPDGTQLVCVNSLGGVRVGTSTGPAATLRLQIASVGGTATTVGTTPGSIPDGARLAWSRVNSLGLTSPASIGAKAVAGWSLT